MPIPSRRSPDPNKAPLARPAKVAIDHGPPFDPQSPLISPSAEFLAATERLGVAFEPGELDALARYLGFLADASNRFNLTAVTDGPTMWMRHILDSVSLIPVIASAEFDPTRPTLDVEPLTVLDVGSGGGLPGMPLAIALPDARITLLEATGKKVRFLQEVVRALGLQNVTVVQDRAEDAGRDRSLHRERYDIVTSRAVGGLATLVELTVPFAKVGGLILAIKGERADEEIAESKAALHALHAHALETIRTETGTIVPIRKMRTTPKIYPRRAGEPKRAPLRGPTDRERFA